MFRQLLSVTVIASLGLLAGCSGAAGDDSTDSTDQDVKVSKANNAFLMDVLTRAGVPEVSPVKGILGVGPSRTATIALKTTSGGLAPHTTNSGDVEDANGNVYGDVEESDFSKLSKVLVKGGASWVKGEVRCCDIPVTDTLTATVSCHTVVAPGSPVNCTITPAAGPTSLDDKFLYDMFTAAGVAGDTTRPLPGSSVKYTAHVTLAKGGIAPAETGTLSWGTHSHAITSADFARVQQILEANGSIWGMIGPIRTGMDMPETLESEVTCWESVTLDPIAHCTYDAANIRPL
jgi:hypothetical protein